MKYNILTLIMVFGMYATTNVYAQADHSFNYQGQLLDNGSPANGEYDILVQMVDGLGADVGNVSVHENTQVTNGLFNINVNIGGIGAFDGYDDYAFEISVRPGASGGSFTVLSPLQGLRAVPLATNLVNGNATSGQVLTFNGFQWAPQTPANSSPWTVTGTDASYAGGLVAVGTDANDYVNGSAAHKGLMTIGANASQITFDGDDIQKISNGSPSTMYLNYYGGNLALGSISYTTTARGNVKQPLSQNGIMKYMVSVDCKATPTITRYYNGVNSAAITVSAGSGSGSCVVNFPADLDTRYWQVSAVYASSNAVPGARNATCRMLHFNTDKDKLRCERYITTDGSLAGGEIMILVY